MFSQIVLGVYVNWIPRNAIFFLTESYWKVPFFCTKNFTVIYCSTAKLSKFAYFFSLYREIKFRENFFPYLPLVSWRHQNRVSMLKGVAHQLYVVSDCGVCLLGVDGADWHSRRVWRKKDKVQIFFVFFPGPCVFQVTSFYWTPDHNNTWNCCNIRFQCDLLSPGSVFDIAGNDRCSACC